MTKPKTLEQLRAEKERAETQLAQEQHKLERLENRKKYLEKGERTKRTHRLCNLGGTIESLAPEVKDLNRAEMTELMEHIFSLSEVQRAVRHMAITHISQANREKELKDMLKENINSIYEMIDSLSDEELFEPHMRKWADEATKTAVWEVYKFIHVNTVAPFGTFRTKIRKWKKIVL